MNAQTKTFYKIFPVWQDDREEEWLRQQARQGWHLVRPGIGSYLFQRGQPQDIVYRLDYTGATGPDERQAYFDLFQQAGWELVSELVGWQYFRKPARPGEVDQIYTDAESKIARHNRLLTLFGILTAFLAFNLFNMSRMPYPNDLGRALVLFSLTVALCLNGYALLRTYLRIRDLKGL